MIADCIKEEEEEEKQWKISDSCIIGKQNFQKKESRSIVEGKK